MKIDAADSTEGGIGRSSHKMDIVHDALARFLTLVRESFTLYHIVFFKYDMVYGI